MEIDRADALIVLEESTPYGELLYPDEDEVGESESNSDARSTRKHLRDEGDSDPTPRRSKRKPGPAKSG